MALLGGLGLAWVQPAFAQLTFQRLHSFGGGPGDGAFLPAGLVLGSDGALYGTTYNGGSDGAGPAGYGTVFKVNTDGTHYLVIHSFDPRVPNGDAENPSAGLVQGSDGALYGTTYNGGTNWYGHSILYGAVFKLNTDGIGYKVIHDFAGAPGDGANPAGALVQGSDHALYGTTWGG